MEKQMKDAFDRLKMSDKCAERISSRFNRPAPRPVRFAPIAVVASLLLVIFMFTNSTAVQALELVGERITEAVVSLFHPDAAVEEQHEFEGGNLIVEKSKNPDGTKNSTVQYNTGATPSWLKATGNGLYFFAAGEHIEISGLISNETPFTYIFTDANEIRHYIAIGGTYHSDKISLETVYWAEWFQKPPYDQRSWAGGYANGHYDNRNECYFGWYEKGKEILDIPW